MFSKFDWYNYIYFCCVEKSKVQQSNWIKQNKQVIRNKNIFKVIGNKQMCTYQHMLWACHRLKANKRNLHRQYGSQAIQNAVRHINAMRKTASHHQRNHMQRYQIDEKHVATPRRHHVEICQSRQQTIADRAGLHRFHPQKVCQKHAKDGNAFVVIWTGYRAAYIARYDWDECSRH